MYIGDYAVSSVIDFTFTTVTTTGAPTQLAGTPAISVYKNNSTTQTTTGVTLTIDFDTVTGLNHIRIDTSSDGTFYATANDFHVIITTGTVGGTSVVGYTVGTFSLQNRSALRPTTSGRTLDVATTGEAGLDFDNIKAASAPTTLTNITVPTTTVAGSVTGNVGGNVVGTVASVVGNVGGNVTGSVGSVVGNVGGNVVGSVGSVIADVNISDGQIAVKRNTSTTFTFPMFSTSTGQMVTGKTVSGYITEDGAAVASLANAISEVGSGFYTVTLSAGETNNTEFCLKFSATGCKDLPFIIRTQA